jgi:hypothetical protein
MSDLPHNWKAPAMRRRATVHPSERNRHHQGRRWVAFAASAAATLASLVTMTAFAGSASAHDAPPLGNASCQTSGPNYLWQVSDGSTYIEKTSGEQWSLTSATSDGTINGGSGTGTGDTNPGPTFTVTGIADSVASITVTTHLVWGTAPTYSAGSSTMQTTINRPPGGCVQSVAVPGAPTVTPPTCFAVGSLAIPTNTASVVWSSVPAYTAGGTGAYAVTATAQSGYVFTGGSTTKTYNVTVLGKVTGAACDTVTTPVAPSIAPGACTGPGTQSNGTLTIPSTPGVIYTINGLVVSGTTVTGLPGSSVTVVAKPASGFKFTGVQEVDYAETFTSAGNCLVHAAPVAPASTNGACTTPGQHSDATLTIPTTPHVVYRIGGIGPDVSGQTLTELVGSTVDVVATPATGYSFSGPQSVTDSITFTNPGDCTVTARPVVPSISQSTCTGPGTNTTASLVIPTTRGVIYRINGKTVSGTINETGAKIVTVTAVPAAGYTFAKNAVTSWTEHFTDSGACFVGVTVAKPGFTNAECNTGTTATTATYTIPSTKHVSYTVNGKSVSAGTHSAANGSTVTVTAIADTGYSMGHNVSTWTHTFGATPTCHGAASHHVHRTPGTPGLASTGVATEALIVGGLLLAILGLVFLAAGGYRTRNSRL